MRANIAMLIIAFLVLQAAATPMPGKKRKAATAELLRLESKTEPKKREKVIHYTRSGGIGEKPQGWIEGEHIHELPFEYTHGLDRRPTPYWAKDYEGVWRFYPFKEYGPRK